MKKQLFLLCMILDNPLFLISQQAINPDYAGYILKYKEIAVKEMKLFHIPASITLAQGIIESNCGVSPLASQANNHFGVKCHNDWKGETYLFDDDDKQECFRKYASAEDSYRDHSLYLVNKQRYAALFSLDLTDYTGWAMGLKQAGYATNPDYPRLLIHMIEMNRLYLYDDTTLNQVIADRTDREVKESERTEIREKSDKPRESRLFRESYRIPDPSDYKQVRISKLGRKVYENNDIPFIFIKQGDTWYNIASEYGIDAFQVYRENDMKESDKLTIGQMIYLEPKKRKSTVKTHLFREDETLYSVSQLYGIKLKMLYKYNNLKPGEEPVSGKIIQLSKSGGLFR